MVMNFGKILIFENGSIKYTCSSSQGGSPIISRYFNISIIGLHRGISRHHPCCIGNDIIDILNNIKRFFN